MALLTIVNSAVLLALPWLAGHLLGGIVAGSHESLGRVVFLLIGGLVGTTLLTAAASLQSARTSADLLADVRQRLFDHVQRLPIGFHESRGKGDTLALLTYEVFRLSNFLTGTLTSLPAKLLTTAGAILLMFRIDVRLAITVPILIPIFYLLLKIVGRRLRSLAVSIQRAEARVVAIAEEMLEMLPATKAFTRELAEAGKYHDAVAEASRHRFREARIYAWLEPVVALTASLAAVMTLALAGQSVDEGGLSASQLFSFIFYAALLTRPISSLANVYGEVQTVRGTLARMQSVLEQPTEEFSPGVSRTDRARGDITFRSVSFAYPGRDRLLHDLSFEVSAGETVALLGPNGSGKTAIINLLLRYYDAQSGEILLDGENISHIGVADLRRQIGLVPQTPLLFNATIGDNIGFGAADPAPEKIEHAARLAQAWDFIRSLPHGFDTMIGDRGVRLSGGQRQRIALARALIKDPPVLIFDEATSMFDAEGEKAFISECAQALQGRTVIIVTHRPATLALADRVLFLESGSIRDGDPTSPM